MSDRLKMIANWVPFMKQMSGMDSAITIWNTEGIVQKFFPSKELKSFVLEEGFQFPDKEDALYKVMQTGKVQHNSLPKEVFGEAIYATIIPILENGKIVGAITSAQSTEKKEAILENTSKLKHSVIQTEQSIEKLLMNVAVLTTHMNEVQQTTDLVRAQVEEANQVVVDIQKNANYSGILALNASIESARAGQAGRGFAVVSEEMSKFSKMSGEAATKINKNLENIIHAINEVKEKIDEATESAIKQSQSVNELEGTFKGVAISSDAVSEICKK